MCFSCPVPFSSTNSSDSSQKIRWLTDTQRCERFQLCISKPLKPLAAPLKQCAQSLIFGCARQLSPSRGPWRSEWHHINGGLVLLGNSTGNHSCSWCFIAFHGYSWSLMVYIHGYSWCLHGTSDPERCFPRFFPCHPLFGNISQSPTVPAGIAQAGGAGLTGLDRLVDQLLGSWQTHIWSLWQGKLNDIVYKHLYIYNVYIMYT